VLQFILIPIFYIENYAPSTEASFQSKAPLQHKYLFHQINWLNRFHG